MSTDNNYYPIYHDLYFKDRHDNKKVGS